CGGNIDLFGAGGGEREAIRQGIPFLGGIPIDPEARQAGDSGTPFVLEKPSSQVAQAFGSITDKVIDVLRARV
ncbi:P-loop NTPase, partial [Candidatus Bipolaricaulota bacterium]|nr:P-loop NTPase [Candidatus Bipolaricaulota bacterium]